MQTDQFYLLNNCNLYHEQNDYKMFHHISEFFRGERDYIDP